jgi:hypothetical protein
MNALIIVMLLAAAAVSAGLTTLGFRPVPGLADFHPDRVAAPRYFANPPEQVRAAYLAAATRTPGMRIADQGPRMLYLDSRPTARILAGNFGVALRAQFVEQGPGTVVHLEAQAKVWGPTRPATLLELERSLRMRAKDGGITEVIHH